MYASIHKHSLSRAPRRRVPPEDHPNVGLVARPSIIIIIII